jgi:hypothetical protein
MELKESFVFISTPTSGTGSLWRIISIIASQDYKLRKIAEEYSLAGKGEELTKWIPEELGYGYMYNTPHIKCESLKNRNIKIITNIRDPRDITCNQYHWIFQHPDHTKSEEELIARKEEIRRLGIDGFALNTDNSIHFNAFKDISDRLTKPDPRVLKLSYAMLCLDFDNVIQKLVDFFNADNSKIDWAKIEAERTTNLKNNPAWIGQIWSGADIHPGRYARELKEETITTIDQRYQETLDFARKLEDMKFRRFLTTKKNNEEELKAVIGKENVLFLHHDSNNVIGQIQGEIKTTIQEQLAIAKTHFERSVICREINDSIYIHSVIPNKEVCLRTLLPPNVTFQKFGLRPLCQYLEGPAATIWKPHYRPALIESESATEFFPLTDSHWNHNGALRYLTDIFEEEIPSHADTLKQMKLKEFTAPQTGDLGIKLYLAPDNIKIITPAIRNSKLIFNNHTANEGAIRHFKNDLAPIQKRVFILHDSYTTWLFDYISELFAEALFFHGTIFDTCFIKKYLPNIIFCIQVERFFLRPPINSRTMLEFVEKEQVLKNSKNNFSTHLRSHIENPIQIHNRL